MEAHMTAEANGQDDRSHHPLPASDKARRGEIPETMERERDFGDNDAATYRPPIASRHATLRQAHLST
jgi:hypothetical protein